MRSISQLSTGDGLVKEKETGCNPARTDRWRFDARSFTCPNWAAEASESCLPRYKCMRE
jgi:hypothetical protein